MDLDLEKFFARVSLDILMGRLATRIGDRRVLCLIRLYLQAGVMVTGTEQGLLDLLGQYEARRRAT